MDVFKQSVLQKQQEISQTQKIQREEENNIQITKKMVQPPQPNSLSVVNKMSQSVYADHNNQSPPKGKVCLRRFTVHCCSVGDQLKIFNTLKKIFVILKYPSVLWCS